MAGPLFLDFFMNQVADTVILFLVKQKKYPEKNSIRVLAGGCCASISYSAWRYLFHGSVIWIQGPAAVLIISILLMGVFQIHTLIQLLSVWNTAFLYTFITGGGALAACQLGRLVSDIFRLPVSEPWKTQGITALALIFCGCCSLISPHGKHPPDKSMNFYQVEIHRGEACVKCTGLYDSGNLLTSQITGEGICVITEKAGKKLLKQEESSSGLWCNGVSGMQIYPIRYHCISEKEGLMPGIMADQIIVSRNGRVYASKRGMVGICMESLSNDGRFSVLLPEDIFS